MAGALEAMAWVVERGTGAMVFVEFKNAIRLHNLCCACWRLHKLQAPGSQDVPTFRQVDQPRKAQRGRPSPRARLDLPQDAGITQLPQQGRRGLLVDAMLVRQPLGQLRSPENGLGEDGVQQVHRVLGVSGLVDGELHLFVQRLDGRHPLCAFCAAWVAVALRKYAIQLFQSFSAEMPLSRR